MIILKIIIKLSSTSPVHRHTLVQMANGGGCELDGTHRTNVACEQLNLKAGWEASDELGGGGV